MIETNKNTFKLKNGYGVPKTTWRCFSMGTRVSYPADIKRKVVEMLFAGIPVK
ncbi:hypothetical protein [Domibacillus tundrae]|uniref:hypothetical protein n=1 Tax=Domibacillus tundrae TaxID=1587527 RepID=UPI00339B4C66